MNDPEEFRRFRRLIALGIVGLLVLVSVSVIASLFLGSPSTGTFRPFFPFGWLGGIFLLFVFFWLLRWLFWPWRWGWHYPHRYWHYRDESYYIIRERFAKGEITKEQFEQMMHDLKEQS